MKSSLSAQKTSIPTKGPALNAEQKLAVNNIKKAQDFVPFLLDGITGSGKTEVYLQVILEVLKKESNALYSCLKLD